MVSEGPLGVVQQPTSKLTPLRSFDFLMSPSYLVNVE